MTADVIIVGAGLAGCSLAWHLAPHRKVLVLEQGSQPGAEASAHNAGMVRRMGEDPYERALAVRTVEWLADPGEDWADLSPSRVVGAVLGLVRDPHHLHDAVSHLRARGVQVAQLGPGDLPPALRDSPVLQAWHLPDERVADAHALVTGFLRGARRHGAEVRCGVTVRAVTGTTVTTDQGVLSAGAVVLAAGAWSARLAPIARPLFPVRRTLLQSAPHALSALGHPWCWIDDEGLYVRPEAGGWLCSPCDEAVDPPAAGPGSSGPVDAFHRALAHDKLERLMPALADLTFQGGWTGLRTFAPDRRPLLGQDPEVPGLWWVAGLGGFGVTCSYAVGEVVAAWMNGEVVPWMHPESVSPGRRFPSRWLLRPEGDQHHSRLVEGRPDRSLA